MGIDTFARKRRLILRQDSLQNIILTGDEHRYVTRALRMRPGDWISVGDGRGTVADCKIVSISKSSVALLTHEVREFPASTIQVVVGVSILKTNAMEVAVKMLTEIGVHTIVPIEATRSLSTASKINRKRLNDLIKSAAAQSGRAWLPILASSESLRDFVGRFAAGTSCFAFTQDSGRRLPSDINNDAALISGPEGGFAPEELEIIENSSFGFYSLGPHTLRAETASCAAAAAVFSRIAVKGSE